MRESIGRTPDEPRPGRFASELFQVLWRALTKILGTAATATLLRRSQKAAVVRRPELAELLIRRDGLQYGYVVPQGWSSSDDATDALRELVASLVPLLLEMTGSALLERLDEIPEIQILRTPARSQRSP